MAVANVQESRESLPKAEKKRQVLALISQGWGHREAGSEFGVAYRTVGDWVARARATRGASSVAPSVLSVAEKQERIKILSKAFRSADDKADLRGLCDTSREIARLLGDDAPTQQVIVSIQHVMGVGDDQDPLAVFSRSARQLATAAEQHQEQARALLGAGSKVWQAQQAPGEPPQAGASHTQQEPLPNLPHFSIDQTPVLDSDSSLLTLDSDLLSPVDDDPDV